MISERGHFGHLSQEDSAEAKEMVMALGMKYYNLISQSNSNDDRLDMYSLSKVHAASLYKEESTVSQNNNYNKVNLKSSIEEDRRLARPVRKVRVGFQSSICSRPSATSQWPFVDDGSQEKKRDILFSPPACAPAFLDQSA